MAISVLLVDDSAVIRGLMSQALSADPEIVISGKAADGSMAITMAQSIQPNIIILDIEMPVMDGITALPELLKVSPSSKIIMASTLTLRNAAISMQALSLGASDYLAKPSAKSGDEANIFYRELIGKIKALNGGRFVAAPVVAKPIIAPVTPATPITPLASGTLSYHASPIYALAIASSTGGPQALMSLFEQLKGKLQSTPIFITQHMPPTFTTILAQNLSQIGGRTCIEATDGTTVTPGHAYVARGDYHMLIEKENTGRIFLRTVQTPPENYCRPAADPMLRSLSQVYGSHLLTAVLTGMGHDGMEGAKEVVKNGGSVIAQDEATCVVYGMPKAIIENNLHKAALPLPAISQYLIQQIEGRR